MQCTIIPPNTVRCIILCLLYNLHGTFVSVLFSVLFTVDWWLLRSAQNAVFRWQSKIEGTPHLTRPTLASCHTSQRLMFALLIIPCLMSPCCMWRAARKCLTPPLVNRYLRHLCIYVVLNNTVVSGYIAEKVLNPKLACFLQDLQLQIIGAVT